MRQLRVRAHDFGGKHFKGRAICFVPNSDHDVNREMQWQYPGANQLPKPPFETISRHGGLFVFWNDEADTHLRCRRTRVRGSCSPDVKVHGPDALPLSHDTLYLRAACNARSPRKTSQRRLTLRRTCPGCGR